VRSLNRGLHSPPSSLSLSLSLEEVADPSGGDFSRSPGMRKKEREREREREKERGRG